MHRGRLVDADDAPRASVGHGFHRWGGSKDSSQCRGDRSLVIRSWAGLLLFTGLALGADLRLVVVDPVHFHAAQLHTKPMQGFARDAFVYAPVGKELAGYFNFVGNLKARSPQPDHWRFHIYSGDDFFDRMLKERAGEVVVLSGRNWKNIDYIEKSVAAGLHV